MGAEKVQRRREVVARAGLLARGYNDRAIQHRVKKKRLHPVFAGVYAVGRPNLSQNGWWMAAVLASGPGAVLSGDPAAVLWRFWSRWSQLTVSVPQSSRPRNPGIKVHRRKHIDATQLHGIPVTTITATLIDFAASHPPNEIEAALNEADIKKLIKLEQLRTDLERAPRQPGLSKLNNVIDVRTFSFTRSALERAFKPIARAAGLGKPVTGIRLNDREFDFYFPDQKLLIETDGGTFHRTPFRQGTDAKKSNSVALGELALLRFTHGQIRHERAYVLDTLRAAARRRVPG